MPDDAAELLQQANQKLRLVIELLRPEKHSCLAVVAEDMSSLRANLVRAGEFLRKGPAIPPQPATEFDAERSLYQNNLLMLYQLLPDFFRRLLGERSRLLAAQRHLASAAKWASGHRETL